jgi:hypothetical protein
MTETSNILKMLLSSRDTLGIIMDYVDSAELSQTEIDAKLLMPLLWRLNKENSDMLNNFFGYGTIK